jgi:hypothetical protein
VIYLHIGRNKAGSTTLQDLFAACHPALEAVGIRYVLIGRMKDSVPGQPGFSTLWDVATYAKDNPQISLLISNEFLSGWPPQFIADAATALRGLDTTVIAYTREYSGWVGSAYGFDVGSGWNARDFDDYVEWIGDRVSYWPALERWGQAFGWHNMRIRSLNPASLHGGELIDDCLDALGVGPALAQAAPILRSNTAMPWMTVELTRAMVGQSSETGWDGSTSETLAYFQQVFE